MIAWADWEMVPALRALWRSCFGDPEDYLDLYFGERFRPEEMLVWTEEGRPASMLTLLPAQVWEEGEYRPIHYVYAVATLPEYRGQGISTRLLEEAFRRMQRAGEPRLFLAPAEPGLFPFYEDRGYRTSFFWKEAAFPAEESRERVVFASVTPERYREIRDRRLRREGYVRWDRAAVAYGLREAAYSGGSAWEISSRCGQDVALCYKIGKKLVVRETTLPDSVLRAGLSLLARRMGCTQVWARLPSDRQEGERRAAGMSRGGSWTEGYANLVLD